MKLFIITSPNNLSVIKDTLTEKYPKIEVQGTNSLEEGIDRVTTRHMTENYDIFIIMSQNFIEVDLTRGKALSDKLNKACLYAIKDLPVYFMVNSDKKEYQQELKKLLNGENIHMYLYRKLHLSVVEEIIKEVGVLTGRKKNDRSQIEKAILEEKQRKLKESDEGYLYRIFNNRMDEGREDFSRLSKIRNIVTSYSGNATRSGQPQMFESSSKIIAEIKGSLFDEPVMTVKEKTKAEDFSITPLNKEALTENFKPNAMKQDLEKVSPEFKDHMDYMGDLTNIIEQVKLSDREDKHQLVVELIQEKAYANNRINAMLADFITKVANESVDFVTTHYSAEINALHEFGAFEDIDELVGGRLEEIEKLKSHRNVFKDNVGNMVQQLQSITTIVSSALTEVGKQYLHTTARLETELVEYANEHNITLDEVAVRTDTEITTKLQNGYKDIASNINALIQSSTKTVAKLMELVGKDEEIINKQDEVIDIMMTHKTKKVLVVNNNLQTKLQAFYGIDGVGKTHSALNLATAFSKYAKVLLFDLNLDSPSLCYYNNKRSQEVGNPLWFNANTITLEEFMRIGITKHMYKDLPFDNNLTIVQPTKPTDLTEFSRTVNPEVFGNHVKDFLEPLAQFYDKIFIILPESLTALEPVVREVGVLHIVNDFEPKNQRVLKSLIDNYRHYFEKTPITNIIINKQSKYITTKPDEYIENLGFNIKDCTVFNLPVFPDSTAHKVNGNVPYLVNVGVKRYFDDYVKKSQ